MIWPFCLLQCKQEKEAEKQNSCFFDASSQNLFSTDGSAIKTNFKVSVNKIILGPIVFAIYKGMYRIAGMLGGEKFGKFGE